MELEDKDLKISEKAKEIQRLKVSGGYSRLSEHIRLFVSFVFVSDISNILSFKETGGVLI